jgi:hypothetical protein
MKKLTANPIPTALRRRPLENDMSIKSYGEILKEIGVVTTTEFNRFRNGTKSHVFQDHQLVLSHCALDAQSKAREDRASLLKALRDLEPFFDGLICYASTQDEYEPNRLVAQARAAIAAAT